MMPEGHALHCFFNDLVSRKFDQVQLGEPDVCNYIAALLTGFCDAEEVFKIHRADGRPITDVGEMLLEADPVYGQAESFDRERQVRKHIGDFTMFITGMYPESINHYRLRRQRLEHWVDFMKAGKESYYIVSTFDIFEYAKVAPTFRKLSEHFEECVYGLHLVKEELQEQQHPLVRREPKLVM